jgi:hypothetical protein
MLGEYVGKVESNELLSPVAPRKIGVVGGAETLERGKSSPVFIDMA